MVLSARHLELPTCDLSPPPLSVVSGKHRVRIERIADARLRQLVFTKRKNGVFRRAMELSVLCDCDVAVLVFDSRGRLYQYSSGGMAPILERYASTCTDPHEAHTTEDLYQHYLLSKLDWEQKSMPARKRQRSLPYILAAAAAVASREAGEAGQAAEERGVRREEPSPSQGDASEDAASEMDDGVQLTPRSAQAYARIAREFDRLIKQVEVEMETAQAVEARPSPEELAQQEGEEEEERQARAGPGLRLGGPEVADGEEEEARGGAGAGAGPEGESEAGAGQARAEAEGDGDRQQMLLEVAAPAAPGNTAVPPDAAPATFPTAPPQQQQPEQQQGEATPTKASDIALPYCPRAPGPIPLLGLPPAATVTPNPISTTPQPVSTMPQPLATQPQQQAQQAQQLMVAAARLHNTPPGLPGGGLPALSVQTGASAQTALPAALSLQAPQGVAPGQATPQAATLVAVPGGLGPLGAGRPLLPMVQVSQQHPAAGAGGGGPGWSAGPSTPTAALGITVPAAGSATGPGPVGLMPVQLVQQMQQALQAQGFGGGHPLFLRSMLTGGGGGGQPHMATLIPTGPLPPGAMPGHQRVVLQFHPSPAAVAVAAAATMAGGGTGGVGSGQRPLHAGVPGSSPLAPASAGLVLQPGGMPTLLQGAVGQPGTGAGPALRLIPTGGVAQSPGGMPAGRGLVAQSVGRGDAVHPGMVPAAQLGSGGAAVGMQQHLGTMSGMAGMAPAEQRPLPSPLPPHFGGGDSGLVLSPGLPQAMAPSSAPAKVAPMSEPPLQVMPTGTGLTSLGAHFQQQQQQPSLRPPATAVPQQGLASSALALQPPNLIVQQHPLLHFQQMQQQMAGLAPGAMSGLTADRQLPSSLLPSQQQQQSEEEENLLAGFDVAQMLA